VIPLRRWAFPRPCGFPSAGLEWVAFQSPKSNPLVELGLRLESPATAPSRSTTVIRLLSWTSAPFSTFRIEGPLHAGFCLPATFRLQGLATLLTAFSLRSLAGFVSHRQRSWDSPFGAFSSRKVSRRFRLKAPTYRFSRDCARRRSGMPASRAAVSGLLPLRESLAGRHEFNVPSAGCSLGLRPSRVIRRAPWPGFRPASSHALSTTGRSQRRSASEYRSMPAWSHPPETANRPDWVRQPS